MNTFAYILLAFPIYLATKGRLVGYVQLATRGATPQQAQNSAGVNQQNTSSGGSVRGAVSGMRFGPVGAALGGLIGLVK